MTELTGEALNNVFSGILRAADEELRQASKADLEQWWFFKWDVSRPIEWNAYLFHDRLDMYKRQCRRWEEIHNGNFCVVERVRDEYLMPKIREFLAELAIHSATK